MTSQNRFRVALAMLATTVLAAPGCARRGASHATANLAPVAAVEPLASRVERLSRARPTGDEQLYAAHAIVDHVGAVPADVASRLAHQRRTRDARATACLRDQLTVIDAVRHYGVEHQSALRAAVWRANDTDRRAEFDYLANLASRADAIRVAAAQCATHGEGLLAATR